MKRILLIGSLSIAAATFLADPAGAQDTLQRPGALARTPSYTSLIASLAATPTATEKITNRTVTRPIMIHQGLIASSAQSRNRPKFCRTTR